MKAGIYILNYNGKELLEICLPSICEAASKSRRQCRIVVVDNLSTDGSREFVAENFPSVEFRGMKENRVLCSFNDAVRDSDEDIVLLMNNDLKVDPGFLDPLLRVFEEKDDAFAAIPCCMSFDGKRIEVSKTLPVFEWGLLKGVPAPDGERIKTLTYTLQGGFGAFSRKRFREIGGYDDLYLPGIIDDTDLCVRAWKKGYACYYQPGSVICHMGRASFKKAFGLRRLLAISHRNTYLFAWKHIDSWKDFLKHVFFIPVRLVYSLIALKPEIVWGFFWAVKLMPEALARRKKEKDADHELGMKDVLDKITGREWSDFYKDSKSHEEISENLRNHRKFLDEVIKGGPKKIIEIGCGSGTMAAFLSSKVEHVVSVDNDPGVLDAARRNCEKIQGKVDFKKEDAFMLSFKDDSFDTAFSQGFFEHFSDEDIKKLLREQLRVSRQVVMSVPTVYYRNRDFGNERLLSRRRWRKILKNFKIVDDEYYLYLRRKKNFLIKLPMMYMARIAR